MKVEEVEVKKEVEKQVTATHSEIEKVLAEASADILHDLHEHGVIDDVESHILFTAMLAKLCLMIDRKLFKEEK